MDFKKYLEKLRALPDNQKKIVLWIIVVIVAVVMGFFWVRSAGQSLSKLGESTKNINLPKIDLPNIQLPSISPSPDATTDWQTYKNDEYGFEFRYDPTLISPYKKDNTIYINFAYESPTPSGDYIKIFNKNIGDSFVVAIKKNILADFPSPYCEVNIVTEEENRFYKQGWTMAYISDEDPNNFNEGPFPSKNNCNNRYLNIGSPGLFLYNPLYTSNFLFYRSGAALDSDQIISTFKFTK